MRQRDFLDLGVIVVLVELRDLWTAVDNIEMGPQRLNDKGTTEEPFVVLCDNS